MADHYPAPITELHREDYQVLLDMALSEDHVDEDVSTLSVFKVAEPARAKIIAREAGTLAGIEIVREAFLRIDAGVEVNMLRRDGEKFASNDVLVTIEGNIQSLLRTERTALNFLGPLSGVATRAAIAVEKAKSIAVVPLDTRKTLPGYRRLLKYAVSMGGARNHRHHLADMGLIKENHITQAGSVTKAIQSFRKEYPDLGCQVEVETLEQLDEALLAAPDLLLFDNMQPAMIKEGVERVASFNQEQKTTVTVEASGGYSLNNVHTLAGTGVDFVSMGALTSKIEPIDFSMLIEKEPI